MSKKITCEDCGKLYRSKCFTFNPVKKKKLCRYCHNRTGTNKFYTPPIKGAKRTYNRFTNYNLTLNEKQALYKELISHGMSATKAKARVNSRSRYINWFQRSRWKKTKQKEEGSKTIMKRLIEGLKCKK